MKILFWVYLPNSFLIFSSILFCRAASLLDLGKSGKFGRSFTESHSQIQLTRGLEPSFSRSHEKTSAKPELFHSFGSAFGRMIKPGRGDEFDHHPKRHSQCLKPFVSFFRNIVGKKSVGRPSFSHEEKTSKIFSKEETPSSSFTESTIPTPSREDERISDFSKDKDIESSLQIQKDLEELERWKKGSMISSLIESIELETTRIAEVLLEPELDIRITEDFSIFFDELFYTDEKEGRENVQAQNILHSMVEAVWEASKFQYSIEEKVQAYKLHELELYRLFRETPSRKRNKKGPKLFGEEYTYQLELMQILAAGLEDVGKRVEEEYLDIVYWQKDSQDIIRKFYSILDALPEKSTEREEDSEKFKKILKISGHRSGNQNIFRKYFNLSEKLKKSWHYYDPQLIISEFSPAKQKRLGRQSLYGCTSRVLEELRNTYAAMDIHFKLKNTHSDTGRSEA